MRDDFPIAMLALLVVLAIASLLIPYEGPQDAVAEPEPLPITHMIQVIAKDTGDTAIWYAKDFGVMFPEEGEFEFSHWRTTDGKLLYQEGGE